MYRKLFTFIFVLGNLFYNISIYSQNKETYKDLIIKLDSNIKGRNSIIKEKENRIKLIKNNLKSTNLSYTERYKILQILINEYIPYQFDSTIFYIRKSANLAYLNNDNYRYNESLINLALRYAYGGVYLEAYLILNNKIVEDELPENLKLNYYVAQHKLNDELSLYSVDTIQKEKSKELTKYYYKKINEIAPQNSTERLDNDIWNSINLNHYKQAKDIIKEQLKLCQNNTHIYAKLTYMYSLIERIQGHTEEMKIWLARSACADMKLGIRDYASLSLLAKTMLEEGDVIHSMKFMNIITEDSHFFNSKLRPWQDSRILSEIEKAYNRHEKRIKTLRRILISFITLFSIFALLMFIYTKKRNNKLRLTKKKLLKAYKELNSSNIKLKTTNENLKKLNNVINEANLIKEEYIGVFLMMCSDYINKISTNRINVRRLLSQGKIEELKKEYDDVYSTDKDIKEFNSLFDTTFLKLYPHFVEEFNKILKPEKRVKLKQGEQLNTELRIFALIRLGINDSSKIAALLRYSKSTVYNYRSIMRNNSLTDPNLFEEKIKDII